MKDRPPLPPGPYLVVGLARSGAAAARMLGTYGEVIGVDSGGPPEAQSVEDAEVHLGSDGLELLDRARTVVKSPGVRQEAPVIAAARERGLDVLGEMELAWRLLPNELIAVTGTNGKTTTSELLGAIHRQAGVPVRVAGNVGTALASIPGHVTEDTVIVCEASSFQLEDTARFAPECAVLLNIEADHIDRHGSLERYREAKLRAFANQGAGDVAVVPPGIDPPGQGRVVRFSRDELEQLVPPDEVRLRGVHNLENAAAAAAAALARGIAPADVAEALRAFAGVPHRLEEVREVGGVLFVNDSKATNVASALVGVRAFEGDVHLILGGSLKGGGFAGLRDAVAEHCRACYLIGEATEQLAQDLDGAAPLRRCGDLERAVAEAAKAARPGEVVLLSPACASYDQYADFEARGDHFKALVRNLG